MERTTETQYALIIHLYTLSTNTMQYTTATQLQLLTSKTNSDITNIIIYQNTNWIN